MTESDTDAQSIDTHAVLEGDSMAILELAIAFFVLAIIAGALGAGGVAGLSMDVAKWLVIVFLVLAVLSLVF